MLLLNSQKSYLVTLIFEKVFLLGKLAHSLIKTLLVKLKGAFSFSLFNFEHF
jgi:hypothetical protein